MEVRLQAIPSLQYNDPRIPIFISPQISYLSVKESQVSLSNMNQVKLSVSMN